MGVVFFFQAEDGIRDGRVTGVQTCALPISHCGAVHRRGSGGGRADVGRWQLHHGEREPPQSYPPRTVHGGSASELWGAKVPGRTRETLIKLSAFHNRSS